MVLFFRKELLLLFLTAATIPEPTEYRTDHYRAPVPDTLQGAAVIHARPLRDLIRTQHPVLIDVLPAPAPPADDRPGLPRMPMPHRDLPGSTWLAETGRGALTPATENWFKARLSQLTAGDKARSIVFYCLSQCWMSWNAAKRAVSYGYKRVDWFPEGSDGWEALGYQLTPATPELPPAS